MKIFLTGGTGFIGAPLTRKLIERGWQATVLTRSGGSPDPATAGVKGDVTDKESMRAAMAGADVVIHNAGWYELGISTSVKTQMTAINVQGTANVLSLAVELKIPKIIYISTCNVFGDTRGELADETFTRVSPIISHYEQTKTDAHEIAKDYQKRGAPLIIVCPAQVIGPGDHSAFGWYARLYVRGLLPPAVWAPEGTFTFGHVDDIVEGIALAMEKGKIGETYILGGGAISVRNLMPVWKQAVGGIPPFIWLPRPLAVAQGILLEPILRLFGLPAFISREVVENSYVCFRFSSEKAKRELGWNPRSVEQAWIDTMRAEKARRNSEQ
jgi:dihydroflavonol-4-reductase